MEYFDEHILIDMIEFVLPRFSPQDVILTFTLRFEWNHYSKYDENNHKFFKRILVAIHRPDNHTKVMIKELHPRDYNHLKDEEIQFDLKCDHDSCWKSDGFRFLFDTWLEAERYFQQFDLDIRKPNDVSSFHGFDVFKGNPKIWKVEMPRYIDREERKVKIKFLNEMKLVPIMNDIKEI